MADLRERLWLEACRADTDDVGGKWRCADGCAYSRGPDKCPYRTARDYALAAVEAWLRERCAAEPSDEDVERAAIAAATAHYGSFVWERAPQEVQDRWRNIARATIAALDAKEPS